MTDFWALIRDLERERRPNSIRAVQALRELLGASPKESVVLGRLTVHFDGRDPEVDGKRLPSTRRKLAILRELARRPGYWVSKDTLATVLWDSLNEPAAPVACINTHMSFLRCDLRAVLGYSPIECSRGLGYRIAVERCRTGASLLGRSVVPGSAAGEWVGNCI